MEKAKQVTSEYLNDEKEELTSEQEIKKSEDIKIEINTLLHMYLPDHLTIAEVDALAMCMTQMIYNPEDYLCDKPSKLSREEELLEEARRRGYKAGVKIKNMCSGVTQTLSNNDFDYYYFAEEGEMLNGYAPENEWYTEGANSNPRIYNKGKWAQIIPEEEKKSIGTFQQGEQVEVVQNNEEGFAIGSKVNVVGYDPFKDSYSVTDGHQTFLHHERYLRKVEHKSLHDQIREGGWEKIQQLSKLDPEFNFFVGNADKETEIHVDKLQAYSRLLALSKVLNEGKERGEDIFTVNMWDGKLKSLGYKRKWNMFPIDIYTSDDSLFALEFAEKEWKIFYNVKAE